MSHKAEGAPNSRGSFTGSRFPAPLAQSAHTPKHANRLDRSRRVDRCHILRVRAELVENISGCSRNGCAAKWSPLVATDPAVNDLRVAYEKARVRAEATVGAKAGAPVLMLYEP